MSWIERAKVGDKVVCVDNESGRGGWVYPSEEIAEGCIYTISDIFLNSRNGAVVFHFIGYERPRASSELGRKVGYGAYRFKPVIKSTDKGMSVLRGLLNTKSKSKEFS